MSILIKLLSNGIIAVPGLMWSGTSLSFALVTSVVISLISYVAGDLFILPRTNNTFASTADFGLAFALLWLSCALFAVPYRLSGIFLTAFAISIVEYFYHNYLQHRGVHHSRHPG
ncbi:MULTISPECIES: DUF2512 family protein [Brevibacillus]|uniref:DUF2512 family protein n=1 Tax=Brevibacillus borstelensis AK1 TaxID=1300222 RepID=M8DDK4_9BACL|nr:DUF2512 family protein [Brevibacillus borstelensis]EMT54404.1 hypothetical protein I532_02330 [Brevibacillus borstelensis AK1]KKX54146.1 hypothetical protein X546_17480 [Brevibacillus borstelensis cifa_chp40]MBE5398178.1 DUF2512 family protein [Brevibacillus borstelensis]MCC0564308.1 YndM family protein [Brevibacillus borstelensis]MCM3472957.1 YndM family protein [Brevibacillus borstelensis]